MRNHLWNNKCRTGNDLIKQSNNNYRYSNTTITYSKLSSLLIPAYTLGLGYLSKSHDLLWCHILGVSVIVTLCLYNSAATCVGMYQAGGVTGTIVIGYLSDKFIKQVSNS